MIIYYIFHGVGRGGGSGVIKMDGPGPEEVLLQAAHHGQHVEQPLGEGVGKVGRDGQDQQHSVIHCLGRLLAHGLAQDRHKSFVRLCNHYITLDSNNVLNLSLFLLSVSYLSSFIH